MKAQSLSKTLIKEFHKEWKTAGFKHIAISRLTSHHQHSISIQAAAPIYGPPVTASIIITPGLTRETVYVVMDIILPNKLPLATQLSSLCAFSQRITALIAPLSLVIDIESEQCLLRQTQLISAQVNISSQTFITRAQQLTPQLLEGIHHIMQTNCTPEDARLIATYMNESWEGVS